MNIAVILAAGSGTRMGSDTPKQFLAVCGKTILEHTVEAFQSHGDIDEIAIVTRTDCVERVRQLTATAGKVRHVVAGGKERYHSTLAALNLYTHADDRLLFHDCVRPLVSHDIITRCIRALGDHDAIGVGVPATDTIWQVTPRLTIDAIPQRSTLFNAQTPQGFRQAVIRQAYDRALADPAFAATDDCGVVMRYMPCVPIFIVQGEPSNIKITYPDDLAFAERILGTRRKS